MTRTPVHALTRQRFGYFTLTCDGRKTRPRLLRGAASVCPGCRRLLLLTDDLRLLSRGPVPPCSCGRAVGDDSGTCERCHRAAVIGELTDKCTGHPRCMCSDHVKLLRAKKGRGLIRVNRYPPVTVRGLDSAPF